MRRRVLAALMAVCAVLLFAFPTVGARAVATNIKLGVNVHMPPYQFLNDHGEFVGIHIEMFDEIAASRNLQAVYVPYESDAAALAALDSGEVDAVLGARTLFPAQYDFKQTGELTASPLCLVAPNQVSREIEEKKNHYYFYPMVTDYLTQFIIGSAHLDQSEMGLSMRRVTANADATFHELLSGEPQIAIMDKESVVYQLDQTDRSDEFTILNNNLMTANYTILVRSSDSVLQRSLETGISDLRLGDSYQHIRSNWIKDSSAALLRRISQIAAILAGIALCIIGINVYVNSTLKKKVNEKTREILEVNGELTRRMEELERAQRLQNSLVQNWLSGIVLFDESERILLINQRGQMLSDYSEDAAVGGNVRKLKVFGELLGLVKEDIFRIDPDCWTIPWIATLNEGGKRRTYRYRVYGQPGQDGKRNALMMAQDVTTEEERRQAAQEEEKNKSLNMLIAGIAHEIKNPLMAIQTYTSVLPRQIDNPDYLSSLAKNIPQEVKRINRLVEALINYARPVKGEVERMDFSATVLDSLYLARASATNKRIRMEVAVEEGVYVTGNKDKVKQAVLNVAVNGIESVAQKLERDGGGGAELTIRVWTERRDGKVLLHIHDEGLGMTESEIRHCTDPFFTTKRTGTGLGMSLVKQFVAENNGTLSITSVKDMYTEIILSFWEASWQ